MLPNRSPENHCAEPGVLYITLSYLSVLLNSWLCWQLPGLFQQPVRERRYQANISSTDSKFFYSILSGGKVMHAFRRRCQSGQYFMRRMPVQLAPGKDRWIYAPAIPDNILPTPCDTSIQNPKRWQDIFRHWLKCRPMAELTHAQ